MFFSTKLVRQGACVLALTLLCPSAAVAQGDGIRLGPVTLLPRIAITNIGIDDNVLRDSTGRRRDFTAQVAPGVGANLQIASAVLSSQTTTTWHYFRRARSQRSLDLVQGLRLDVPFTRLKPYAAADFRRTRQRPTIEIDERVRREDRVYTVGAAFDFSPMFGVFAEVHEGRSLFGDGGAQGAAFAAALDRVEQGVRAGMTFQLTPLTSLSLDGELRRDEFRRTSLRDSERRVIGAELTFEPVALISGSVRLGLREFDVRDASVPDERGLLAAVDASYVIGEMTKFAVQLSRDVDYSFSEAHPYFVSTQASLSITQVVGLSWDVVGRYSILRLDYRDTGAALIDPAAAADIEEGRGYALGVGRHFTSGLRIGFEASWEDRESDVGVRNYEGLRAGGTVTYGF